MIRTLPLVVAIVALSATACSDAPKRPAKLGLYMMIRNPSDASVAGKQCGASSGIEWDIGKTIKENGVIVDVDSPTPTDFGTTLEDGKSNVSLTCTIRKNGSVNAEGGGIDPQIMKPNGTINFTFGGTAKESGTAATNKLNVSVYTPATLNIGSSPTLPGCSATAVHEQAPGALWADFTCPALVDTSRPDVACQANGTIVMEYCDTGEEE
jgi:hypothetical protein